MTLPTEIVIERRIDPGRILGRAPSKVAVFAQPSVVALGNAIAEACGAEATTMTLPDADAAKSLATVESVWRRLLEVGLSRSDTVVAVGGGALTDVVGFAAATYMRGVDVVYVPTTLLGAVDAAIGGKTGINMVAKNTIGAFRHPRRVVIDIDVIDSQPIDGRRQGFAEALKAGFVGDPDLVGLIERTGLDSDLVEIVQRAVDVKVSVVEEDFEERGRRAILNYGHTVGHGVEIVGDLSHGESVAVGMVAAGAASEHVLGFDRERHDDIIAALGLPTEVSFTDRELVVAAMAHDKKRSSTQTTMVLLKDIGRPVVRDVDAATLNAAFSAIGL